jgi:hypothetical protein
MLVPANGRARVVGGITIIRIGFVVVKEIQHREKEEDDSDNCSGDGSWIPDVRPGSGGPGRTLAGNWRPGDWLLYQRLDLRPSAQTLIWPHYTPVRPRTPPSPPPVSSFGSVPAIPSLWPRVTTYPGRDSWRGGVRGPLRSRAIRPRKEGTRYEIERQKKCDFGECRKFHSASRRGYFCKPRTKSRGNQAPRI